MFGTAAAVVVLALAGCNQANRAAFEKAAAELPAAEAEAKRLNLPLTGEALMPNPPVKPEDNAKPLILEATAAMQAATKGKPKWMDTIDAVCADPNPTNRKAAQDLMNGMSPALDLAVQAAAKPHIDFERNWKAEDPINIMFPELSGFRELAKGLVARARLRSLSGDVEGALSDFRAGFKLGRFVGSEPVLIGALVHIACDSIVVRGMELSLALRPNDQAFRDRLNALAAEQAAQPLDMVAALRGEVIFGLAASKAPLEMTKMLGNPDSDAEMEQLRKQLNPPGVPKELLQQAYRARILQFWNEIFAKSELHKDPLALTEFINQTIKKYEKEDDPASALNRLVLPVFDQAGQAYARREVGLKTFRGLLAVLKYRAKNGKYPKTLAEAGVDSVDPFTGKPLQLKVSGDEVRVYSLGPDKSDQGGGDNVPDPKGGAPLRDIVSKFPRKQKA